MKLTLVLMLAMVLGPLAPCADKPDPLVLAKIELLRQEQGEIENRILKAHGAEGGWIDVQTKRVIPPLPKPKEK